MVSQKTLIFALIIFITGTLAMSLDDPCANYTDVISHGSRSPRCPFQKTDEKCDEFLTPSWFRIEVDGKFPLMTSHCPETDSCGAYYPIWLNGTHPTVDDDIVDRTTCLRYSDNCCDQMKHIQIKNCTDFFVYFLSKAPTCPGRYCFDSDAACPTPPTTTSSMTSTTVNITVNFTANSPCSNYTDVASHGSRSPRCPYQKADEKCDEFLTPSWFRFKVGGEFPRMTSHCPETNTCGAYYPIWLNGTHPTVDDDIVDRTTCLRYSDNCCDQMTHIQIKNCTDFLVYFLSKAPTCPGRYCFDSEAACPTPPMTTTSTPSTTVNSTAAASVFLNIRVLTCVLSVHALLIV